MMNEIHPAKAVQFHEHPYSIRTYLSLYADPPLEVGRRSGGRGEAGEPGGLVEADPRGALHANAVGSVCKELDLQLP